MNTRLLLAACLALVLVSPAAAVEQDPKVKKAIGRGLEWLAHHQSRAGHWAAQGDQYPAAMTALSGMAMIAEGSTTTQGKYSENIRRAVDFLSAQCRSNGLIGDPIRDNRYTYGHGFAMLFLSQVLGEEEDQERRENLLEVLTKAVQFTGRAQCTSGGWGYVSAKDGNGFDEGSTTITQVQGLRACRNAGVPVPKEVVDKAIKYIKDCTTPEGGVLYRHGMTGGGARPPITAAAIACLFNAGAYDSNYVPKLIKFCKSSPELQNLNDQSSGHWHYAHYYYSQVMYRQGDKEWDDYRDKVYRKLVAEQGGDGSWNQGYVGPVYTTATNLTILQLEKATLPIYQR
jgi:hypothetical protein